MLSYDGNGVEVKRAERAWQGNNWSSPMVKYFIRSSVLGGNIVSEANTTGAKEKSYVYGNGAMLARQGYFGTEEQVAWQNTDASGLTERFTSIAGTGSSLGRPAELEPTGNNVGAHHANPPGRSGYPESPGEHLSNNYVSAFGGCSLDGLAMDCDRAMSVRNEECRTTGRCPELVATEGSPWMQDIRMRSLLGVLGIQSSWSTSYDDSSYWLNEEDLTVTYEVSPLQTSSLLLGSVLQERNLTKSEFEKVHAAGQAAIDMLNSLDCVKAVLSNQNVTAEYQRSLQATIKSLFDRWGSTKDAEGFTVPAGVMRGNDVGFATAYVKLDDTGKGVKGEAGTVYFNAYFLNDDKTSRDYIAFITNTLRANGTYVGTDAQRRGLLFLHEAVRHYWLGWHHPNKSQEPEKYQQEQDRWAKEIRPCLKDK